jgi:hypothetical protein
MALVWTKLADKPTEDSGFSLLVLFNNDIYVVSYSTGELYKYNWSSAWVKVADALPQFANYPYSHVLVVYNNELYCCNKHYLCKFTGTSWQIVVSNEFYFGYYALCPFVYENKIHAVGEKRLLRWDGGTSWTVVTTFASGLTVAAVGENGKLYLGSYDYDVLFEYYSGVKTTVISGGAKTWFLYPYNNKIYYPAYSPYSQLREHSPGVIGYVNISSNGAGAFAGAIINVKGIFYCKQSGDLYQLVEGAWAKIIDAPYSSNDSGFLYYGGELYTASNGELQKLDLKEPIISQPRATLFIPVSEEKAFVLGSKVLNDANESAIVVTDFLGATDANGSPLYQDGVEG